MYVKVKVSWSFVPMSLWQFEAALKPKAFAFSVSMIFLLLLFTVILSRTLLIFSYYVIVTVRG